LNLPEAFHLDLYAKYNWTHQKGDTLTISSSEVITFEDADSSRIRVGARATFELNGNISPFFGAVYVHEFDGQARATTNSQSVDFPSLKGGTGFGEIGLSIPPRPGFPYPWK
jgi:outer membrane autotransporter protein